MTKHSKYYWEKGRNGWSPDWQDEVINDKDKKWEGGKINPKMFKSKEELGIDYSEVKTPNYYIGSVYGYEARKVIEDYDLSYNLGTATSYILRCSRKHDNPINCIQKAINHLEFELDKIKNKNT